MTLLLTFVITGNVVTFPIWHGKAMQQTKEERHAERTKSAHAERKFLADLIANELTIQIPQNVATTLFELWLQTHNVHISSHHGA